MIHCPKCSFEQPEDQYCASCGIDMHSYVPPKTPLLQRFIRSPFVHIMVLVMIIGGIYNYVQHLHHQEVVQQIDIGDSKQTRRVFRNRKARARKYGTQSGSRGRQTKNLPAAADSNNAPASRRLKFEATMQGESLSDQPAAKEQTLKSKFRLRIVEINTDALNQLIEASQSNGIFFSSGELAVGITPTDDIPATLKTLKTWSGRFKTESKEYDFFAGNAEADLVPELGLRTFLIVSQHQSENQIELEVVRSLPIVDGDSIRSDRQVLKETLQLTPTQSLFVIGLLPSAGSVDSDSQDAYPAIFSTLFGDSYQNRESDMALILTQE